MLSLSDNNQADIIEAFNSTSRYLDDLLNIDNPYFEQMVGQIYPTEVQLNKANSYTVKPVLSGHSKRRTKIGFQDRLSLNAGQKYCRMLRESILQYF